MPMTVEEALTAALDDEYRARATYRAVLDAYGDVRPFVNVVESEERHIQALRRLCERYDVGVPADPWPSRISAPESLEAACKAAVEAEAGEVEGTGGTAIATDIAGAGRRAKARKSREVGLRIG